jgi:hypothetical protein
MVRSIQSGGVLLWLVTAALLSPSAAVLSLGPKLCVVPQEEAPVVVHCPLPARIQVAPPPVYVRPYQPSVVRFAQPPPPVRMMTPVVVSRPVVVTRSEPVVLTEPADALVDHGDGGTMDDRGEGLRAARRVVVGGGYGGLVLMGDASSSIASAYRLHIGLALRQVSVGFRLDVAPDALEIPDETGDTTSASYLIGGLGFGYHFNAEGLLHPVMGASLEVHSLDPSQGDGAVAFGIGGRAGLELEYPLDSGSLGIGLDFTAHRRLLANNDFPARTSTAMALGGYVDYRF